MSKNTSISLSEHYTGFIDRQVREGKYSTASEVIRAGLRLLEDHQEHIEAVRAALIKGEQSGEPRPFDVKGMIERKRRQHQ